MGESQWVGMREDALGITGGLEPSSTGIYMPYTEQVKLELKIGLVLVKGR